MLMVKVSFHSICPEAETAPSPGNSLFNLKLWVDLFILLTLSEVMAVISSAAIPVPRETR